MTMKVNGTTGLTFPDTTTLASAGQSSVQAWVNFNGTGTVAIRASYNVSSITDNGAGDYTVNFTTALPDANYSAIGMSGSFAADGGTGRDAETQALTTTSVKIISYLSTTVARSDYDLLSVAIFR